MHCLCLCDHETQSQRGSLALDKGQDQSRGAASLTDVICSDFLAGQGGMRVQDADAVLFPGRLCFPVSINRELLGASVLSGGAGGSVGAGEPASTCAVSQGLYKQECCPQELYKQECCPQGLYKQECCPQGKGRVGQPIGGAAGSTCGASPWTAA